MYYKDQDLEEIKGYFDQVEDQYWSILRSFSLLEVNVKAFEYVQYGFLRRIGYMRRCLVNVFRVCPPQTRQLSFEDRHDVTINIHSYVINTFGAYDNLAWVWERQKKLGLSRKQVGLTKNCADLRKTFSEDFKKYLEKWDGYFDQNLIPCRHSLAHRIPLYIPPSCLNEEERVESQKLDMLKRQALTSFKFEEYDRIQERQAKLGTFFPVFAHPDSNLVHFHHSMLVDWVTIVEFSEKFKEELFRKDDLQTKSA